MEFDVLAVLFYYPNNNYFTNEDGIIIYDIFAYITPGDLIRFREYQDSYLVYSTKLKGLVELMYLEQDDLDYILEGDEYEKR